MKIYYCLLLVLYTNYFAFAQQDQTFLVYPFQPININPAMVGSKELTSISFLFRKQGIFQKNLSSSAQQYLSVDLPLRNDKFAIGFQAFSASQSYGVSNYTTGNLGFYGDFAYRVDLPNDGILSFGLQVGTTQVPSVSALTSTTKFVPNLGVGVFYKNNNLQVGISKMNLNAKDEDNYAKPLFLYGKYLINLNSNFDLLPGVVVKNVAANGTTSKTFLDINAKLWYNKKLGIGIWNQNSGSEFSSKAFLASLEYQINDKLRFGYSYDFQNSNNQSTQNTTTSYKTEGFHQFQLLYEFDSGNGKVLNFRYF